MQTGQPNEQLRNLDIDKTNKDRASGDPYANQGGGKQGSGNTNSGELANNVITPEVRHDANPGAITPPDSVIEPAAKDRSDPHDLKARREFVPGADVKGSGTPTLTGAGVLADDRPGRNEPKAD